MALAPAPSTRTKCTGRQLLTRLKTVFTLKPNQLDRFRREADVADHGLRRLHWADSGHSLLTPESAVARKERTFLDGASQDSLQPQYALLDSLP
jgi:hypothetical protein